MTHGDALLDLHECDPQRFDAHGTSTSYARLRGAAGLPRGLRRPAPAPAERAGARPAHDAVLRAPGSASARDFFESAGWERPQWYEANRELLTGDEVLPHDEWAARFWSPIVQAEHRACRERVGIFDLTPFTKVEVRRARRAGLPAAPGRQRRRQAGGRDRLHGDALAARRDHVRPDDHAAGRGPLLGRHGRRRRAPRRRVDAPPPARRRLGRPHRPHLVAVLPGRLGPAGARPRRRAQRRRPLQRGAALHARRRRCTSATSRAARCACPTSASWAGRSTRRPSSGAALWDTLWRGRRAAGRGRVRRRRLRLAAPGEGLPAVGPGHRRGARPLRGRPGLGRAAGQGRGLHRPRGGGRGQGARRHAPAVLPGHRRPRGHARRQGAAARRRRARSAT